MPQIREEIDFRGEWAQTASEEDFLLVDIEQNDQNRLVPFATVGNLEKFCEAETIYIDRTFKASPQLFYQFFTVHAVYNSQHIHHIVNRIPTSSSYRQHHFFNFFKMYFINSHFVNFPLRQLPTSSIPTLSIPTLSTLTKWELTKWELTKWELTMWEDTDC